MTYRREWDDSPGGGGRHRWSGFGGWSASKVLVLVCVIMQFVNLLSVKTAGGDGFDLVGEWLSLRTSNAFLLYPFVSYAFLHDAGNLFHLILNMLILLFLGQDLEAHLGRRRFLSLYFGAALVGGLIYVVGELLGGSNRPVQGASGAVFGLIAYIAWWTPQRTFILYFVPVSARVLFWIFVAIDLYSQLAGGYSTTAHMCHLGGALGGYLFWKFQLDPLSGWKDWTAQRQQRQAERSVVDEAEENEEMDRILRKIHTEGMPSLTTAERRFIERRSKKLRKR